MENTCSVFTPAGIMNWDLSVAPESSADYWVLFNQQYNAAIKAINDVDTASSNALTLLNTTIDKEKVVDIKKDVAALQNCKLHSCNV